MKDLHIAICVFVFLSQLSCKNRDAAQAASLRPYPQERKDWVAISPSQCANAWNREKLSLKAFLDKKEVVVYSARAITNTSAGKAVCKACTCAGMSTLYFQVRQRDAEILGNFGFIRQVPPANAGSYALPGTAPAPL